MEKIVIGQVFTDFIIEIYTHVLHYQYPNFTLQELQARHAAQRLAERLNVKLDKYNPEGVDMSYRESEQVDIDSDDEPEVVGYTD